MPCGAEKCRCTAFTPQKWAPSKCHSCFHWDHQHDMSDGRKSFKQASSPPASASSPADITSRPVGSVNASYKYPGLGAAPASSSACFPSQPLATSPSTSKVKVAAKSQYFSRSNASPAKSLPTSPITPEAKASAASPGKSAGAPEARPPASGKAESPPEARPSASGKAESPPEARPSASGTASGKVESPPEARPSASGKAESPPEARPSASVATPVKVSASPAPETRPSTSVKTPAASASPAPPEARPSASMTTPARAAQVPPEARTSATATTASARASQVPPEARTSATTASARASQVPPEATIPEAKASTTPARASASAVAPEASTSAPTPAATPEARRSATAETPAETPSTPAAAPEARISVPAATPEARTSVPAPEARTSTTTTATTAATFTATPEVLSTTPTPATATITPPRVARQTISNELTAKPVVEQEAFKGQIPPLSLSLEASKSEPTVVKETQNDVFFTPPTIPELSPNKSPPPPPLELASPRQAPPPPAFSGAFAPTPTAQEAISPNQQRKELKAAKSVESETVGLDRSPRLKENAADIERRTRQEDNHEGPDVTSPQQVSPLKAHRRVVSTDIPHRRVVSTDMFRSQRTISTAERAQSMTSFEDDSDEDDSHKRENRQETVASLSSKVSKPFVVVKGNKYGVKQNRILAIDDTALTLKFCDMSLKLKSEVPVAQISIAVSEDNDRKVALSFKQRSRVYDLLFESAADCSAFAAQLDVVIKAQQEIQRKEGAALLNAFMSGGAEEVTPEVTHQYQEYRVMKKNQFRHKQQRILVLKPTSLVLLDGDRKVIKSFAYGDIYSVETNAQSEDKKTTAYEAETFIVFHQAAKQNSLQVFFPDSFDRQLFAQSLRSFHSRVLIKDGDNPSSARFMVTKTNTATATKGTQRILEILASESVLRSYDRVKHFKDTSFKAVRSIEPCAVDNKRVFFEVQNKRVVKRFSFDFTDCLTRARFLAMSTFALDSERTVPPGLKLSIFCGTWNVGGSAPSDQFFFLDQFIQSESHEIYAIAMQECPQGKREDWVVEFQRHCGGHSREFAALSPAERKAQARYEIIASSKLWEISILILIRKELAYKVTGVTELTVACGVGDLLGNKGAAAVVFRYEDTNLGFVSCHLAARAERLKERRQDFLKIVKGIRLQDKEVDIINACDHLFWFGDLNYRVEKGFHDTIACAEAKQFDDLAACDQLRREMAKGFKELVFPGFQEGRLAFPPTYRWEKTRNVFSNKREQAPSYTDRVLWHSLQQQSISLDTYGSAPDVLGSDHRPCFASFTVLPRSFQWGGRENTVEVVLKSLLLTAEEPDSMGLRLVVTGPFLRWPQTGPPAVREIGTSKWQWAEGMHMRAFVERDHVAHQHLLVCVQGAQTQECVGYTTIPLVMHESRFRTQLTKDGVLLGWLSGNLSVYVTPEDEHSARASRRYAVAESLSVD